MHVDSLALLMIIHVSHYQISSFFKYCYFVSLNMNVALFFIRRVPERKVIKYLEVVILL